MENNQPEFQLTDFSPLTIENWISILKDDKITKPKDLIFLHAFYISPNHEAGASRILEILGLDSDSPVVISTKVRSFVSNIRKSQGIELTNNRQGGKRYWDVPFLGYSTSDNRFIWRIRPELVQAWKRLEEKGFIQPIIFNQKLVEKYKRLIQIHTYKQEGYKWQLIEKWNGHPSIDAEDFAEEIKQIDFSNLLFHNARRVSHHIAQERSEQYRICFKSLFDTKISLQERVSNFTSETLKLYRDIEPENKLSHHHDERTISAFLAYHNSEKYILYKSSFHKNTVMLWGLNVLQVVRDMYII